MKYFTIIKCHTGNDLYSVVLKSWELDENDKEINCDGLNLSGKTLDQVDEIERLFRLYGSNLKGE